MKFGKAQDYRFGTLEGAYSVVTSREYYDSQITLTDYEAELLIKYFGRDSLHVGNVGTNPVLASKTFRLYPHGETISLNLVFPKPHKTELRLYLATKAGFKPEAEEVWFVYVKDGEVWIGSMSEYEWRVEGSILKNDDSDLLFQESLDEINPIRQQRLKERDVYARDRNVALKRLEMANYECEYDSTHNLFISRFSGKPYLEAHHIIPLGIQEKFKSPLDVLENIVCLCPACHRAVHHAQKEVAREMVGSLSEKRGVLNTFSVDMNDLFAMYAIETIS